MSSSRRRSAAILSYPLTWLVLIGIGGFEWSFWAWFRPSFALGAAAGLAGIASAALWVGLLAHSPAFVARLHGLGPTRGRRGVGPTAVLSELEGVGSTQGVAQLQMLMHKRDALAQVLQRRLDSGEMTYARYLATAEQVYLAAMDNLHDIAVALTSASGIDQAYIDQRLRAIHAGIQSGTAQAQTQTRERETLEARRSLLDDQLARVAALFAQNESAMTALDNTTAALAETRTTEGRARVGAEAAMAELERLAATTSRYSARQD